MYLIKTDPNGVEQWSKTFGGTLADSGKSVKQTSDGGYILAGTSASFGPGGRDMYLVKTDSLGNEEWSMGYGGSGSDEGSSVDETSDGGYIVLGYTNSFSADSYDLYLVKTDSLGNEQWNKTFDDTDIDLGKAVQETSDGGLMLFGISGITISQRDYLLIKTDSAGNEQWRNTYER